MPRSGRWLAPRVDAGVSGIVRSTRRLRVWGHDAAEHGRLGAACRARRRRRAPLLGVQHPLHSRQPGRGSLASLRSRRQRASRARRIAGRRRVALLAAAAWSDEPTGVSGLRWARTREVGPWRRADGFTRRLRPQPTSILKRFAAFFHRMPSMAASGSPSPSKSLRYMPMSARGQSVPYMSFSPGSPM